MPYPVEKDYTWHTQITTYDAGADRRLRPSNQLQLQQEVGERHLALGGLTWEELYRNGLVFVLTKTSSVIHRAPQMDEEVWIRTWHRDTKGAQFYRCYQFLDREERPLIESVTAFALVDPVEHKLLRPSVFDRFGLTLQPERKNGCPDPGKIRLPQDLEPAGNRTVYWSDTDYNGHLNNSKYADLMCDFLPGGMQGKRVTGFSISFLKEAREGSRLQLFAAQEPGLVTVCADHEEGRCFEAQLRYEPD